MQLTETFLNHKDEKGLAMIADKEKEVQTIMLTVHDVARMLNCSARTVYRLTDTGRMPKPVKLGALIRWPRETVTHWIAADCPACRDGRKGVR